MSGCTAVPDNIGSFCYTIIFSLIWVSFADETGQTLFDISFIVFCWTKAEISFFLKIFISSFVPLWILSSPAWTVFYYKVGMCGMMPKYLSMLVKHTPQNKKLVKVLRDSRVTGLR